MEQTQNSKLIKGQENVKQMLKTLAQKRSNSIKEGPNFLLVGMSDYFQQQTKQKTNETNENNHDLQYSPNKKKGWQMITKAIFNPQAPQHKIFKDNLSKKIQENKEIIVQKHNNSSYDENDFHQVLSKQEQKIKQYYSKLKEELQELKQYKSNFSIFKVNNKKKSEIFKSMNKNNESQEKLEQLYYQEKDVEQVQQKELLFNKQQYIQPHSTKVSCSNIRNNNNKNDNQQQRNQNVKKVQNTQKSRRYSELGIQNQQNKNYYNKSSRIIFRDVQPNKNNIVAISQKPAIIIQGQCQKLQQIFEEKKSNPYNQSLKNLMIQSHKRKITKQNQNKENQIIQK